MGGHETPIKRNYRSSNSSVERALELQEIQVTLLKKIVDQNEQILDELKKQNK